MLVERDWLGSSRTLIYIPIDAMRTSNIRHDFSFDLCYRCLITSNNVK